MLRFITAVFYAVSFTATFANSQSTQPSVRDKKLIEFGWDEPDTAFMRKHIAEMEKTPFDGCVFHVRYKKSDGKPGDFLWECWGRHAFSETDFKDAIDDLRNTPFTRFTENFLRFNVTPGDVDWFDNFSAIENNAKLAAKIAHDGHCRGVLFDIEQYNNKLFSYRNQKDAASKPWQEYAQQARLRGREVMSAFRQGYPGVTIFLTFGYTLPFAQCKGDPAKLPDADYGLLAPFLDGMLDAAEGNTRIIDGYEFSYSYKDVSRFPTAYQTMKSGVKKIVADPQKYDRFFNFGFGVWLDEDWRKKGWNEQDPQKNFYSPAEFENSVRAALQTSDRYVWIYTETPRWWTEQGGPLKLPSQYEQALRQAAK